MRLFSFPQFVMRRFTFVSLALCLAVAAPATSFALEGIGPRVTVSGIVQEVHITQKQTFNQVGGEVVIKADNGQIVTAVLLDSTQIVSEGKLSRRQMIPANVKVGMLVRVRGWRVDSKTLTASLFLIQNIELNPALSLSGVLQSINDKQISVLSDDGQVRTLTVTNETTVNISYELSGPEAMTLVGKQILLTMNPENSTFVRVIHITGNKPLVRTQKPDSVTQKERQQ